eukprot:g5650.t1
MHTNVFLFTLLLLSTATLLAQGAGIVRRSGTKFVDADCSEVIYSGWNSWQLMEAAAGITDSSLEWILDTMRDSSLTVGRFFGHGIDHSTLVLQTRPGQYNKKGLFALDLVLAAASKRGLRMVLTLTDNWTEADSKKQFANWAGKDADEFYTDPQIKSWFKDHINFMTSRVNSITGIAYRDDPVIFSWNLINEPRCECHVRGCSPSCRDRMQSWIEEMANHLKSMDPNHMVTVGEEGFFSYESGLHGSNPDAQKGHDWAVKSGQDFIANHDIASIDYGAVHCWPDNWGGLPIEFQRKWIYEHIVACQTLGKPMALEEFGKATKSQRANDIRTNKDPFYKDAFNIFESDRENGVFKGIGFWEFGSLLPYGVKTEHSTWNDIIVPRSQSLKQVMSNNGTISACQKGKKRSMDIVTIDGVTYVTPGTNLIMTNPMDSLIERADSLDQCGAVCNRRSVCAAFQFNSDRGECRIAMSGQGILRWSENGWQQYNKQL